MINEAKILDGKQLAHTIKAEMKEMVGAWLANGKRKPHLCAILVGNDGASLTYVKAKAKDCEELGMDSTILHLDEQIAEKELLDLVQKINHDEKIDGLIVQMPVPKHIDALKVTEAILPEKDVDGFHPVNVGRMFKGLPAMLPATPMGIMIMLERHKIPTAGKHAVVIGRSDIVGKPMAALLMQNNPTANCTVTICHSKTQNLEQHTKQADIIIAALGKPYFLKAEMVKPGAVVIDVGITRVSSQNEKGYEIKGDVQFDEVKKIASWITPVPGGVGLMTRIGLLQNTLNAYKKRENL